MRTSATLGPSKSGLQSFAVEDEPPSSFITRSVGVATCVMYSLAKATMV